jgi:hypothetical protein
VDGHPANIAVAQLDLADVQPGADLHLDAAKLIPKVRVLMGLPGSGGPGADSGLVAAG